MRNAIVIDMPVLKFAERVAAVFSMLNSLENRATASLVLLRSCLRHPVRTLFSSIITNPSKSPRPSFSSLPSTLPSISGMMLACFSFLLFGLTVRCREPERALGERCLVALAVTVPMTGLFGEMELPAMFGGGHSKNQSVTNW